MGYNSGHFRRYINLEFWRGNYEEIIKTGFDFPRIFISSIRYEYQNWKEWDQLLKTYYTPLQKENEYYPLLKLIEFTEKYPEFKDLLKPCAFEYQNSVALIFSRPPRYWGLRGDPYFWMYLEDRFRNISIPLEIDIFGTLIKKHYFKLTDGKIIGEEAYIEKFAHGGMSSGTVSDFWLDYIPLLKYRLIKLNNNYYLNHNEYSKVIHKPQKTIRMTSWSLDRILERYDELKD